MKMKSLQAILASSIVLAGCRESNKPDDRDDLTKMVEREIRKHDSWVENEIRSDYKNENNANGKVTLGRIPQEVIDKFKKAGILIAHGYYFSAKNSLNLPDLADAEDMKGTIDAVDHELWHSLYDFHGELGILHRPGYAGPTLEEIAKFSKDRSQGKEFDNVRNNLLIFEEMQDIKKLHDTLLSYINYSGRALAQWDSANEEYSGLIVNPELHDDERNAIIQKHKSLEQKVNAFREDARKAAIVYRAEVAPFEQKKVDELSLSDVATVKDKLANLNGSFLAYNEVLAECLDFDSEFTEAQRNVRKREMDKSIAELEGIIAEIEDGDHKKEMQGVVEEMKSMRTFTSDIDNLFLASKGLADPSLLYGLEKDTIELTASDNRNKIAQVLGDPNEFMARVIDSLYSLHYGSVEQNRFPLNQNDLNFLGRFSYKGKLLFGKGIEKYQLGRRMIADGKTPEEVKRDLEYATSFSYEGKKYRWPEARFTIKGNIPEAE